jgi:arsenite methyltransferase
MDTSEIYNKVSERYSSAALSTTDTPYSSNVAQAFGYTAEELSSIPKDANLGLSCGNPLALAKLSEGETVIDLGSGGGLDVFLAAKRVGSCGKAIGVDMNKDMLARARKNQQMAALENVEFLEAAITAVPLPSNAANCIISNCVINLVPESEKHLVFNEMYRLLKPGGRVALSDILLKKELPSEMKESMALYVGCVAGASLVREYEKFLKKAGFQGMLTVNGKSS